MVGALESLSNEIEQQAVPTLQTALGRWRRDVLIWGGILFSALAVGFGILSVSLGWWDGLSFNPPWLGLATVGVMNTIIAIALPLVLLLLLHYLVRGWVRRYVAAGLSEKETAGNVKAAFHKSTGL